MAKYTTTIQEYCQSVHLAQQLQLNPDADPWNVIATMDDSDFYRIVRDYIFPAEWPFYNESTLDRKEFIEEWTDTFLYYEIGQDSMGKFRHVFKAWLRTNMPFYSKLAASELKDISDVVNNIDVWTTRKGDLSNKSGSMSRSGSTTYGKTDTFTPGKTNKNSIVALGSASTERELNKSEEGGLETNVASGTDTTGYTDTYTNLKDTQDITEHRAGKDGSDVAKAVEQYRALIVDLNSMIFKQMKAEGLFMLVW